MEEISFQNILLLNASVPSYDVDDDDEEEEENVIDFTQFIMQKEGTLRGK